MTHSAPRAPGRSALTRGRVLVAAAVRGPDRGRRTSNAAPAQGESGNKDSYRSGCVATTGLNVPDDTPQSGAE